MGLNIKKDAHMWRFSVGFWREHTQAIYKVEDKTLVVVHRKHLPKIIQYLQRNLHTNEVKLMWYKAEKRRS